jgi:hypothetical protein
MIISGVLIDEAPIDGVPMYFEISLIDDEPHHHDHHHHRHEPMRWCPKADFEEETSSSCDYDHVSAIDHIQDSRFGSTSIVSDIECDSDEHDDLVLCPTEQGPQQGAAMDLDP